MNPFFRNTGILLCCAIVMSACAAGPSTEALVQNSSAAAALPANYRALIARYILTHERLEGLSLNTAMISKPYDDLGAPLWRQIAPNHVPAVCVAFDSRNLLGQTGRAYLLFTIRNGQVERLYTHNNAILFAEGMCPDYTPFRELMKG
jgi:hypothetical protein